MNFAPALLFSSRSLRARNFTDFSSTLVVAPAVFRTALSSRRLLSHYAPALLLSFVETPACICTGIRIFVLLIFLALSPYRSARRPLVNMIFLNSYLFAPSLCYILLLLLFCQILFRPLISHSSHLMLRSLFISTNRYSLSPSVSSRRSCVNLVLILTLFIFYTFLF